MKNLQEFIIVINNILSLDDCDSIVNEYKDSNEFYVAIADSNDLTVRRCKNLSISDPRSIEKNIKNRRRIEEILYNACKTAIETYKNIHPHFYVDKSSGFDLLKYDEFGGYKEHIDDFSLETRRVSASILLNDNFEGGNWKFFNEEYSVKLNKGDIILFPSNPCFPHRIETVTSGTRFSVVTWFS